MIYVKPIINISDIGTDRQKDVRNQSIQLVKILYCNLLTNDKQLPGPPCGHVISEVAGECVTNQTPHLLNLSTIPFKVCHI